VEDATRKEKTLRTYFHDSKPSGSQLGKNPKDKEKHNKPKKKPTPPPPKKKKKGNETNQKIHKITQGGKPNSLL